MQGYERGSGVVFWMVFCVLYVGVDCINVIFGVLWVV